MDHFKVYDSAQNSPVTAQSTRPSPRARAKAGASIKTPVPKDESDSSRILPADVVKVDKKARQLQVSDAQIRAKVASHDQPHAPKGPQEAPTPQSVEIPKAEEAAGPAKLPDSPQLPEGQLAKNDPKDPVTQEKLKGLLTGGGFGFSDQERKTLEKILAPHGP